MCLDAIHVLVRTRPDLIHAPIMGRSLRTLLRMTVCRVILGQHLAC